MRRVVGILAVAAVLATPTLVAAPALAQRAPKIADAAVDCSAGAACTVTWRGPKGVAAYAGTDPDEIDTSPGVFAQGTVQSGDTFSTVFDGLDPSKRYYFELVPKGAEHGLVVADRSLHLESAPNARDIGGYETKDGHHVRWGTVFRSDAISKATDADQAKLVNLGIKVVCDFRGDSEVATDGVDKLPPGAELVALPVLDAEGDRVSKEIRDAVTSGDRAAQQALLGDGKGEQLLVDGGRFFVTSDTAQQQFGALLARLADPAALPALTHCTAGKDRTGWSTAIVLTALGVPKRTVMADYLLTNELTKEKNDKQLQAIAALDGLPELVRPVLEVRREYLQASFDAVRERYGSFAKYLRKGLGVDARTLAALQRNLLSD